MALEFIIGVGIFCFLILYLVFAMDKEHKYLKLLVIGLFVFALIFIPKSLIDDYDRCDIVLNGTNELYIYGNNFTGYHWDYDFAGIPQFNPSDKQVFVFHKESVNTYREECFTNEHNTATSFYKIVLWFVVLFMIYLFLYVAWVTVLKPFIGLGETSNKKP